MKNLIDSLGITHRRFAELYGIPYRTVAAWYTGERKAPEWVKSLIVQITELKKQDEQLSIFDKIKYEGYVRYSNMDIDLTSRNFTTLEESKNWQNHVKEMIKNGELAKAYLLKTKKSVIERIIII